MSDNILFELQIEIMRRLPVKSLVQFRSVSKAWKSVIDSSRFIKHYSSQQHHLLVRYDQQLNFDVSDPIYVSIFDDETFPHQKVSFTPPALVSMFQYDRIIGSSHGLLCLYACYGSDGPRKHMAVVWNISIRKAVAVPMPNIGDRRIYETVLGFGVCHESSDPKIVKITHISRWINIDSIPDSIPSQVEVFTLSTGAWRPPYTTNLPRTSIRFSFEQVVIDGCCYWLANDRSARDAGFEYEAYNLIISFHMTSEEFGEVNLPDSLVYDGSWGHLYISNLRESLVVLDHNARENIFDVWLMAEGVSKSFTKLFTIYSPDATLLSVPEFRKSGEPVIEIADDDAVPGFIPSLLAVYEPKSKHMSNLGINGTGFFYVCAFVETLLLLDQPELTVFDKGIAS